MKKTDLYKELDSEEYKREWNRYVEMQQSLVQCLSFCLYDTDRDGISGKQNFFLRMVDDIFQSVVSISVLAKEGVRNTCRRELRYLIEVAMKSCRIVQKGNNLSFKKQISEYQKLLNSSNINPINTIVFSYFTEEQQEEYLTYTKQLYGYLSKYTHASSHQITERLTHAEVGRTIGFEGVEELRELNNDIERVFSVVLIFLFNAVPQYVVGDFLVPSGGGINDWYFSKSRFVNYVDRTMDYKHERQIILDQVEKEREKIVLF